MNVDRLGMLVETWREEGAAQQEPTNWVRARGNWLKDLPHLTDLIESLPTRLDRTFLRELCQSSTATPDAKFAAVMIWGYGVVGYGSFRTRKMFSTPGFLEKIEESYRLSQIGDYLDAYKYLSKNKIELLGPAFGTKWISFSSPSTNPAPIYDSFVAKWFGYFAPEVFDVNSNSPLLWNLKIYSTYADWMQEQAHRYGVKIDDLEFLIFKDALQAFPTTSKWKTL